MINRHRRFRLLQRLHVELGPELGEPEAGLLDGAAARSEDQLDGLAGCGELLDAQGVSFPEGEMANA